MALPSSAQTCGHALDLAPLLADPWSTAETGNEILMQKAWERRVLIQKEVGLWKLRSLHLNVLPSKTVIH